MDGSEHAFCNIQFAHEVATKVPRLLTNPTTHACLTFRLHVDYHVARPSCCSPIGASTATSVTSSTRWLIFLFPMPASF